MHFKSYIQRFIASCFLLVFILAATPKRFLHSIFADHKDVVSVKVNNKNHTTFSNQSYHCQIDNLVIELPFFNSIIFLLPTLIQHIAQFKEHYIYISVDNNRIEDSLRGPPIYC